MSFQRSQYIKITDDNLDVFSYRYSLRNLQQEITGYSVITLSAEYISAPELISDDLYRNQKMWWIICLYNGIINPITDLIPGTNLKIPDLDQVKEYLSNIEPDEEDDIIEIE